VGSGGFERMQALREFIVVANEGTTRRAIYYDFDGNELRRVEFSPHGRRDGEPYPTTFSSRLGYAVGGESVEGGYEEGEPEPLLFFSGARVIKRHVLMSGGAGYLWSPAGTRLLWSGKTDVRLFSFTGETLWTRRVPSTSHGVNRLVGFSATGKYAVYMHIGRARQGIPQVLEGWVWDINGRLVTRLTEGSLPSFSDNDRYAVQIVHANVGAESSVRVIDMNAASVRDYRFDTRTWGIPAGSALVPVRVSGFLAGKGIVLIQTGEGLVESAASESEAVQEPAADVHTVTVELGSGKMKLLPHFPQRYLATDWTVEISSPDRGVLVRRKPEVAAK
jgi:hypothetical protein